MQELKSVKGTSLEELMCQRGVQLLLKQDRLLVGITSHGFDCVRKGLPEVSSHVDAFFKTMNGLMVKGQ